MEQQMMMERFAVWYLQRRGRVVMPRVWIGLAISGDAIAQEIEPYTWQVILPPVPPLLMAFNGSMVQKLWK
jgi:hypothetical protein